MYRQRGANDDAMVHNALPHPPPPFGQTTAMSRNHNNTMENCPKSSTFCGARMQCTHPKQNARAAVLKPYHKKYSVSCCLKRGGVDMEKRGVHRFWRFGALPLHWCIKCCTNAGEIHFWPPRKAGCIATPSADASLVSHPSLSLVVVALT